VTNAAFMRELRRALRRPWSPPATAWAVRVGSVVLRTEPELALWGRRGAPKRLLDERFEFRFPELRGALRDIYG
jgi:NAD dependent epimerase/dehydratase family enzyme